VRRLVVVLALILAAAMAPASSAAAAGSAPIGAHSMLQLTDPYAFMQAMFAEAAAMHGSAIRLDVAPAIAFGGNRTSRRTSRASTRSPRWPSSTTSRSLAT
jgi:hypothetical protein